MSLAVTLTVLVAGSIRRAAMAAAVCERPEVLDQLIGSGVPVDAYPDTGKPDGSITLLHGAAYWGKPRSVERLLTLGADPNRHYTNTSSHPWDGAVTATPRSPDSAHTSPSGTSV